MATEHHDKLVGFIWTIANKLRGPYRPPQYRRVMLPMIVLRKKYSMVVLMKMTSLNSNQLSNGIFESKRRIKTYKNLS